MEHARPELPRSESHEGLVSKSPKQGQWKRAWSCTRCGQEVKCKVTVDMNSQGLADVTCGKAQWGACEARRLKWSERQRQAELEAPKALQTDGREQVPPPGKHIPHKVLGKRVGRGQKLPQTSHTETSVVGPYDQVEIEHPQMAEMESDLRRTGHGDCRANEGGERASERCEARDVKDEEVEDAAPPHRTSPLRVTDTKSERGRGVSNEGSLQQMEESQERGAGVLQRGQQQLSSREEAPTSERGMPETLMAGEAQTNRVSAARGQAIRGEVF
jgi:hypothetical protein